jgi:phosphoadenosine phosphosulfate reductase
MLLTDLVVKHAPGIHIVTLDTGRLPGETYHLMQQVRDRYGDVVDIYAPETEALQSFVRQNGVNAFYQTVDLRKQCCGVRKIEPLRRALAGKQAWITGLRREQSVTRAEMQIKEHDAMFGIPKFNPLLDWSEQEVWAYIRRFEVPYNALHDQGYPSIGCAPCTRAISRGEDVRAGRWWWENPETKECGLHAAKLAVRSEG